jgi:hypothetical protein
LISSFSLEYIKIVKAIQHAHKFGIPLDVFIAMWVAFLQQLDELFVQPLNNGQHAAPDLIGSLVKLLVLVGDFVGHDQVGVGNQDVQSVRDTIKQPVNYSLVENLIISPQSPYFVQYSGFIASDTFGV